MALDAEDRLRFDYEQTTELVRTLTDIRFKLLAFVPTIAGAAVGAFGRPRAAAELMAVGLLGLAATLGILVYELRNSQVRAAALRHAGELEQLLELRSGRAEPPGGSRLFGVLPLKHDLGLALVYGAAFAGWTYLVSWGALGGLEVPDAREVGVAVGAAVGLLVFVEVGRVGRGGD
jgi:hypothetical protein